MLINIAGWSQQYGNEWIRENQDYYKIKTARNGIYRITRQELVNAGFQPDQVNARRIQLFHRGIEQAIYISGELDGKLDPGDYIEFYGQRNNGSLDAELYKDPSLQPHPYYNLFSDTTAYFLTVNKTLENGLRMPAYSENNVDGLPAEQYHEQEILEIYSESYSYGHTDYDYVRRTVFDTAEGWSSRIIRESNFRDFEITGIENRVTSAPLPELELLVAGRFRDTSRFAVSVGPDATNLRKINDFELIGYNLLTITENINWTEISVSGTLLVRFTNTDTDALNGSLFSVSTIGFNYPASFDMQNDTSAVYHVKPNPVGKSYIEINNVPDTLVLYDITDPARIRRIGYNRVGSSINAIVRDTESGRTLLAAKGHRVVSVNKISFQSIDSPVSEFIIITHPLLQNSSPDPIQRYADYRSLQYTTAIYDIDGLYDQFSYGEITPLAIFNFAQFLYDNGPPAYIFLIGKGLELSLKYHRRDPSLFRSRDLVPSAGMPGADMAFTTGLDGNAHIPSIPIGRLPASSPEDVNNYLDKVIEMENPAFGGLWRKRVLHLSGGITKPEQSLIRRFMDGFEGVAEDIYFGGQVETKQRTNTGLVEKFDDIKDEINNGVGLVTMFGHSNPFVTDIDIGYSNEYSNKGKYPHFLVNGCEAGRIFIDSLLWGIDWVLAPDRGALGFVSHSHFGFKGALRRYTNLFYEVALGDSLFINKPVGNVQQEVGRRYLEDIKPDPLAITQIQQMVLMGDPALHIFPPENPDYRTQNSYLDIDAFGKQVNSRVDSIRLSLIVENTGTALPDSLDYRIEWTLPDNQVVIKDYLKRSVLFRDTARCIIRTDTLDIAGLNEFEVEINQNFSISEPNHNNNIAVQTVHIPRAGTFNLLPQDLSIVNTREVRLKAQAGNPVTGSRGYMFQVDTTERFDAPIINTTINASAIAELNVLLPDRDSTVYYWRTRYEVPLEGEDSEWNNSSFYYLQGSLTGFAQAHFDQIRDNDLEQINLDRETAKWEFIENSADIKIKTYGADHPFNDYTTLEVFIDDNPIVYPTRLCRNNSLGAIAFDKTTLIPYAAIPARTEEPQTCGRTPQVVNNWSNAEIINQDTLTDYMNAVAEGDYVAVFSIGALDYQSWPQSERDQLVNMGVDQLLVDSLVLGEPVIFLGKKGEPPGTALYVLADSTGIPETEQEISLHEIISGRAQSGVMTTTGMGPAGSWDDLYFDWKLKNADAVNLRLFSESDNENVELANNIINSPFDISFIEAAEFPELSITHNLQDTLDQTAPQPDHWIITGEYLPEGVLLFIDGEEGENLTNRKQEGQEFTAQFVFTNISQKAFGDSLVVDVIVDNQDPQIQEKNIPIEKVPPLKPDGSDTLNIVFDTEGIPGQNDLEVNVNPGGSVRELYLENNLIRLEDYLIVSEDEINPVIDVSFDGQYIMDGDIVSPTPFILIKVKDENPYLPIEDTTGIDIYLQGERIGFNSDNVKWYPVGDDEDFLIEYMPDKLADGTYTLKVQASDASGNKSGTQPYEISFEVINESTITHFYPYPNPFSTSTRFIFTLTGAVIPEELKIQILTVSGRVVREITQDEIGPIRIGNNISEFRWDGTDEFGDPLANGVYLYRVITRIGGEDIKHRQTAGDRGFKNGVGKLYILR